MAEEEIVAYTIGSFWLCTGCGPKCALRMHPVLPSHLMDGYHYVCDECGHVIRKGDW